MDREKTFHLLSLPFIAGVASACNGGGRVLQLKTNAVNKRAKWFFCGPLISLQKLAFSQIKIAQSLKKSRVLLVRSSGASDMEPIFDHFWGAKSPFHKETIA